MEIIGRVNKFFTDFLFLFNPSAYSESIQCNLISLRNDVSLYTWIVGASNIQ